MTNEMNYYKPSPKDISKALQYSMCNEKRMSFLHRAVWVVDRVEGDLVEIGVCKGGSSMCMALSSLRHENLRHIHLYDTFAGMSKPCKRDVKFSSNATANEVMQKWEQLQKEEYNEWCYGSLTEVKINMERTKYPKELIHYYLGDVTKDTPFIPEKIALLRIDVDFYEPTLAALEKFYPKLQKGGILIMDDFNCWVGAQKAWTEYVEKYELWDLSVFNIDKSAAFVTK